MSRVAQAWAALTDAQQLRVGTLLRLELGDPGWQLTLAIVRDCAPPPPAEPTCDGCHADGQLTALVHDDRTVQLLCNTCWKARMRARTRAPMPPGDVQQAFPTTHDLERS